jgi:hypothetical protein
MPVKIIVGILVVAATATLADWVWYHYGVRHTVMAGVIHGAALLTVVGAALGAASNRVLRGLPIGAVAGIGGALAYQAFVLWIDDRPYGLAIPAAWTVMWLLLALLEGRWLRVPDRRSWAGIAARGIAAAALSGVAFYLAMNTLWGAPPPTGRNYAMQFAAWAFAWAPGLMALSVGHAGRSAD